MFSPCCSKQKHSRNITKNLVRKKMPNKKGKEWYKQRHRNLKILLLCHGTSDISDDSYMKPSQGYVSCGVIYLVLIHALFAVEFPLTPNPCPHTHAWYVTLPLSCHIRRKEKAKDQCLNQQQLPDWERECHRDRGDVCLFICIVKIRLCEGKFLLKIHMCAWTFSQSSTWINI
jgi:hypothetical protein